MTDMKEALLRNLIIRPFLFLVGILDILFGLILPYKYDDPDLPDKNAVLSKRTDPADPKSAFRSTLASDLIQLSDPNMSIYTEFKKSVQMYPDMKTMGVREILSIDDEVQSNGKVFKKFTLGQYKWSTYEEMLNRVNMVSNGLLNIGLKSNDRVVLFAETRPEWLISALACFRIKVKIII